MPRRSAPPARRSPDRRALTAVAVTFFVNGIVFSSLLPRYPQITANAGATETAFGLALVGAGVGGLAAGVGAPVLSRRVGLVRTTWAAGIAVAAAAVCVAVAPSTWWLAVGFALAGGADALHDISMNEVALGEQVRRSGSIMGRLHGVWSIGSTAAAAVGAGMAALGVPVGAHLAVVAVAAIGIQLWAAQELRGRADPEVGDDALAPPGPSLPPSEPRRVGLRGARAWALVALGAGVLGAVLVEQTPLDWSALMLRRGLEAGPGLAGLGPVVFSAGILLGRGLTDPAVDRLGPARVLRLGNALAGVALAVGLGLAEVTGSPWPALVGLTVAGVGVCANFPLLFGAGDVVAERLALPAGTGTSIVGTFPRLAGLVLPAAIGALAGAVGLVAAVGVTVVGAVLVAVVVPRMVAQPPR